MLLPLLKLMAYSPHSKCCALGGMISINPFIFGHTHTHKNSYTHTHDAQWLLFIVHSYGGLHPGSVRRHSSAHSPFSFPDAPLGDFLDHKPTTLIAQHTDFIQSKGRLRHITAFLRHQQTLNCICLTEYYCCFIKL